MGIDDEKLDEILRGKSGGRGGMRKHQHLIKTVYALYDAGLSLRQLRDILPVSLRWLQNRFGERTEEDDAFEMRPAGSRLREVDVAKVKKILAKVPDDDLRPEVRGGGSAKGKKRRKNN